MVPNESAGYDRGSTHHSTSPSDYYQKLRHHSGDSEKWLIAGKWAKQVNIANTTKIAVSFLVFYLIFS